jgi:hypothetical protein
MPSVIEDAIDNGEYLRLNEKNQFGKEPKGATGVYIKRDTAIVIGKGRIGGRIIDLNKKMDKYGHILVFTDDFGTVRSVYYADNNDLKDKMKSFERQRAKLKK